MGSDEPPPSLPWHANPGTGMVIGLTFLLFCLVGPLALLIPLIAWIVIKQRRRGKADVAADAAFAERFHDLESAILEEPAPTQPPAKKRARRPVVRPRRRSEP